MHKCITSGHANQCCAHKSSNKVLFQNPSTPRIKISCQWLRNTSSYLDLTRGFHKFNWFVTYTQQIEFKMLTICETADNICCPVIGYKITIGNTALTWVLDMRKLLSNE